MKFVAPNAVPRTKRNFTAALDRIFFFDDQTDQAQLTYDNWHMLVPKVRAAAYSFDGTVWKTGHVQGQGDSSRYYPANLGALVESSDPNSYSGSSSVLPPPVVKPSILDYLTFDPDNVSYQLQPLGVSPKRIYGFGGNGFSAPDTRMLFAMKQTVFPTAVNGKLPNAFAKANSYYTQGGGFVSDYIQYFGCATTTVIKPKTTNGVADCDVTNTAVSWANLTDPNIAALPTGTNPLQLLVVERTEQYRWQHIYANGSGASTPQFTSYYNWKMLLSSTTLKDDATFNVSTVQPFYYPLTGTAETPTVSWGALVVQLKNERVILKFDSTDMESQTVTPGTSAQITAKNGFAAPITDQQIFLM